MLWPLFCKYFDRLFFPSQTNTMTMTRDQFMAETSFLREKIATAEYNRKESEKTPIRI